MMSHRILPAALLLCTLAAACGRIPTGSDAQAQPGGPAYDGGFTMGSGNNATQSGGWTIGSGNTGEAAGNPEDSSPPSDTAGSSVSTASGGFTMGSGN